MSNDKQQTAVGLLIEQAQEWGEYKNTMSNYTENSLEFLLEQMVMGTYKNGEDKILYKTLPKSMIDHAFALRKEELRKAWDECLLSSDPEKTFEDYYNEKYQEDSN